MEKIYKIFITLIMVGMMTSVQAQISGDTSLCTGENASYSVPFISGASYLWNAVGGNIAGNSTNDTVIIYWGLPGTGNLFVTVTPPNSIPQYFTITVVIHPLPDPKISHAPYPGCPPEHGEHTGGSPDQGGKDDCEKVCQYATITYSTPFLAGNTYSWAVTGALSISGATTNTVTVTWDSSPTGSLTVYETNSWGCTDSSTLCIKKMNLPVAAFTHQSNVCKFSNVQFNNLSSGATSYQWYFGDGGSSTQDNPSHTYTNGGTYTFTLIAISECYCRDTVTSTITVSTNPGPEISCPSTVCAFDTATYSTSSSGCNYNWFVTGGTIIGSNNQQNVTVAWGAGQLGYLGLYVTGCAGLCSDTTWITVPIVPSVASIAGPQKVCPGDCEEFSLPLFSGATYSWSLNNGSCGQITDSSCCNKVQICWSPFTTACTDTLTVTYFDTFLNCGGTATFIIRVRPKLSIFGQSQGCSNGLSGFYAFPGIPAQWTVSPAGPVITGSPSPSVQVDWNGLTGNFIITALPVNPNNVCNDSAYTVVNIIAPPAAPVISGDTVSCPNNTVHYCATGSGTIHWIITGGTPSTGMGNCINVSWGNTPPFSVQAYSQMPLVPYCSSDTTYQTVHTVTSLPPATFTGSLIACANSSSNFSSTSLYVPGTSFNWTLSPANAGTVITGQGSSSIQVEWGNNAPQTVILSLTSSICGISQTDNISINLTPPPLPSINQVGNLCPGVNAQLQVVGGAFTSFQWSGPGGYTSATNPAVIAVPGLYQVTVTDAGGCSALTQITVFNSGAPQASISALGPLQYCIGSSYNVGLCALGNGNYSYTWSNGPTTQCNYVNAPGSYVVTVTDNVSGCYAVSNILSVVEDSCQPDTGTCIPTGSVSFSHTSCNPKVFINNSMNASSFTWYFGDLSSSNQFSPTHYYNQAGFYTVYLYGYVPDAAGLDSCLLVDTALIEIPLLAKFSFTSGCFGSPVCFTDQSVTTAGNSISSWNWNFGDASTSTLQNPCHSYATPGTYLVTLTISNPNCTTSLIDTVIIAPQPVAAFNFSNINCVNTAVNFFDLSATNINYWNWNFGNAGTSLNQNPSQSYTTSGTYPVTLIVHDIYGCYDTLVQNININTTQAGGSITAFPDTVVCAGTSVLLVAPSCPACNYTWSTGSTNDSVYVTSTGIYSVIVTDSNGCSYSTSIHVIVHQPPYAVISSTKNTLCLGEYSTLSVPYNPNWLYNWISNDPAVNGNIWQATGVSPANPGIYTYQVLIIDTVTGCSDTTLPFIIAVHAPPPPPSITPLSPTTICKGDSVTLSVSHPDPTVSFTWSTGEVNDTIVVTENGCYSVTVTDTNGCTSFTSYCVTVNPLPEVCSFWEGCYDTCAPYLIQGPPGAASYQWLLNGLPLAGDTLSTLLATVGGSYSVIVTNIFGCTDTTGALNLGLYSCPDSLCTELLIDSVFCDPATGLYVLQYYVINHAAQPVNEVNLQVLAPNLNLAYAPNMVNINLNPGDTSSVLSTLIYNGIAGSTICFRSHISSYDTEGNETFCCNSLPVCVTLPECAQDTGCCYLEILDDSIWCETAPDGTMQYHFNIIYEHCGDVNISLAGEGSVNMNNDLYLNGNIGYLSGTYYPGNNNNLCLLFMVHDSTYYCVDNIFCFDLPACPPPSLPCLWEYNHTVCEGNTAWFQYFYFVPGTTYTWQFPGGIPSTASGMGPHYIQYPNPGLYPVQLTMTNAQGTVVCNDYIHVSPKPAGGITQINNSLVALPTGMNYQWYLSPVTDVNAINGATNQFYTPTSSGTYCVVITNEYGCSDTICFPVEIGETCCNFIYLSDSVWCESTLAGESVFHFNITVQGCGTIEIAPLSFGNVTLNNPYLLENEISVISGTYTGMGNTLCLLLMVHDSVTYCEDTTICLDLPQCPPVVLPCDNLSANFHSFVSGYTVNFYNSSSAENGMIILATAWNFGDSLSGPANTSSLQNPSHVFSQPGTYTICLVVVGIYPGTTIFCVKQYCQTITITDPAIEACETLQAMFTTFSSGLTMQFINQSVSGNGMEILSYHWNFGDTASGDNNFSNLQNPLHHYSGPGFYTVCLAISAMIEGTPLICYDTLCIDINIVPYSTISGVVQYDNLSHTRISDVLVKLWMNNNIIASTVTDNNGLYQFDSLAAGEYSITCTTSKPWGGVNATDALLIMKHFVGLGSLHGLRYYAANVDGSSSINANDALLASRRFVGIINTFTTGDWLFEHPVLTVDVNMSKTVNINGLCYGDVNASYDLSLLKTEPAIKIKTQGVIRAGIGRDVLLPVRIMEPGYFSALSLVLKTPSELFEIIDVTLADDPQNLVWSAHGNELRIAWWTLKNKYWNENDVVLSLQLRLKTEIQEDDINYSITAGEESVLTDISGNDMSPKTLLVPAFHKAENDITLEQNIPNPFSNITQIGFTLPSSGHLKLVIHDLIGKEVETIRDENAAAGYHTISLNCNTYDEGVYFYSLYFITENQKHQLTRRMVISK